MARLTSVPGWVRRPLQAVADVEHYLLRLYGRTESPEALAVFSSLSWLGGAEREETPGPLVWRAQPSKTVAEAFLAVADAIADGEPYPPPTWWADEAGCLEAMARAQWDERTRVEPERFFAHGVVCALGWVLGVFDDPAVLAPIHHGDGSTVSFGEREEYRVRLRGFAIPPDLPQELLRTWLVGGPTALGGNSAVASADLVSGNPAVRPRGPR